MNYTLVLQWPTDALDFDDMVEIEEFLIENLTGKNEIDGHDAGAGEMNIFILTDSPEQSFGEIKNLLEDNGFLSNMRAAYRSGVNSDYTILWPESCTTFKVK